MRYGALSISYNGTVPMLDMINIAMSEVSVSSLVSNLAGIDSQSVKELDIFTVTAFDINSSGGGKTIDFKTLTDAEIIQAVNNALAGMKQEYLLSQDNVSVTRLPGDSACDVLNTKTMFHYWLNSKGELSFPPQAYYASKHIRFDKDFPSYLQYRKLFPFYQFPQGISADTRIVGSFLNGQCNLHFCH